MDTNKEVTFTTEKDGETERGISFNDIIEQLRLSHNADMAEELIYMVSSFENKLEKKQYRSISIREFTEMSTLDCVYHEIFKTYCSVIIDISSVLKNGSRIRIPDIMEMKNKYPKEGHHLIDQLNDLVKFLLNYCDFIEEREGSFVKISKKKKSLIDHIPHFYNKRVEEVNKWINICLSASARLEESREHSFIQDDYIRCLCDIIEQAAVRKENKVYLSTERFRPKSMYSGCYSEMQQNMVDYLKDQLISILGKLGYEKKDESGWFEKNKG